METIKLGQEYKDKITEFKGVCTGFCEYLSGCNQALLCMKVDKSGNYKAQWFDVQRLSSTNRAIIKLENGKTPGHDIAAPIR